MDIKKIIKTLRGKSNISYAYYHLFFDLLIELDDNILYHKVNHIIYIVQSGFENLSQFYFNHYQEPITDVFLDKLSLSDTEKKKLFGLYFRDLFWFRFTTMVITIDDYKLLCEFLGNHSRDINRIFIENCGLKEGFFIELGKQKKFENLSFLNFDNNDISTSNSMKSLLSFIANNPVDLEYLSLVNCGISRGDLLLGHIEVKNVRILDISYNSMRSKDIVNFICLDLINPKELYVKGIFLADEDLEEMLVFLEEGRCMLKLLFLSLSTHQKKIYGERFLLLSTTQGLQIEIFDISTKDKVFSTISFKVLTKGEEGIFDDLNKKDNFYAIRSSNFEDDFGNILHQKNKELQEGINLFLFDFHDYFKIDYLLSKYHFNYIYLENYHIKDADLEYFLQSLSRKKNQPYKLNLISIEISLLQAEYLIENLPKNIFYIEVNLNAIIEKREYCIQKMLKNDAFIFENMELYQKIFT